MGTAEKIVETTALISRLEADLARIIHEARWGGLQAGFTAIIAAATRACWTAVAGEAAPLLVEPRLVNNPG